MTAAFAMLDLSSEDFQLYETSGPSEVVDVPSQHQPILQQASQRWDEYDQNEQSYRYLRVSRFHNKHPVLTIDVPPKLYNSIAPVQSGLRQRYRVVQRNEFSHLRYTPVTCDPSGFVQDGYLLQHQLFVKPRPVEICVGITMYNEDEWSLGKTLNAIHRNIRNLQEPTRQSPWGPDSWRKVVVCIISDGRAKIHRKTQAMLAALGLYQDIAMIQRDEHTGADVTMHLFEYTTHSSIRLHEQQISVALGSADAVFCQTIFCLKEKNQKRVNSQRWFMQAICEAINPKVCVTIDAGSIPNDNTLYNLWKPFQDDDTIASTTTFSTPEVLFKHQPMKNPFVGFQQFEYTMNNCLCQPVDSLFGRKYAMNLGNIAAYRWPIVTDDPYGLVNLFPSESSMFSAPSIFKANRMLAEDRGISGSLMRTGSKAWRTVAVTAAHVQVDVPQTLAELTMQRRRFLNGHLYSSLWELWPFNVLRPAAGHSYILWLLRFVAAVPYQLTMLGLQFFAVGNLFAVFCVVITSLEHTTFLGSAGHSAAVGTSYIYVTCFLVGLVYCMGNRPRHNRAFSSLATVWALIYCYYFSTLLYLVVTGAKEILRLSHQSIATLLCGQLFTCLVWPLLTIVVIPFLAPLTLLQRPPNIFACVWYLLLLPMYTNLIHTYAWCNLHDFTWGWKGDDRAEMLPSVRTVGGHGNGEAISKVQDRATGDLIFYGYDEYLGQLDALFDDYRAQCELKQHSTPTSYSGQDKYEDQTREYRTRALLLWLTLNSVIVMVVVNIPSISKFTPTADGGKGLIYVGIVMWAYAGLSLFQYGCTIIYAISMLSAFLMRHVRPLKKPHVQKEHEQGTSTPDTDSQVPAPYQPPARGHYQPPPPAPSTLPTATYYQNPVSGASPAHHYAPSYPPYPPYPEFDEYQQPIPAAAFPAVDPGMDYYR